MNAPPELWKPENFGCSGLAWAAAGSSFSGLRHGTACSALQTFPLNECYSLRKPEIQEIQVALEMAAGKGAGIAKSFVGFSPFRRPWKPEIQEIQGTLEMASGKGAGIAKSTILVLFKVPPISAAMEAGNPEIQGALEMASGKGAGIADNFGAFVVFPPVRRLWKPEIQEIQGALKISFGKRAGIAKSTFLVLLWCSTHFGGLGSQKSNKSNRP